MSADLLRRAAKVLQETSTHPVDRYEGRRWEVRQYGWPTGRTHYVQAVGDSLIVADSIHESDMQYVALMDPPVALALAAWLDRTADVITEFAVVLVAGVERPDDLTKTDLVALAVARAILREPEVTT